MYETVKEADVLAILTEWSIFMTLDIAKLDLLMCNKNIIDWRNLLEAEKLEIRGFKYQGIGK